MRDLLIIGAGPAGLTAALYARRSGLSVLIFDKGFYGGQAAVTNEIENYPAIPKISGYDFANALYDQVLKLGGEFQFEEVTSLMLEGPVKAVITAEHRYEGKTVILAPGVKRRKLGCAGEEQFAGRGVSYCATCDGAFFRNKPVVVVGGGNSALEEALYLANICQKVYLVHRRDTFRGEKMMQRAVKNHENIEIINKHNIVQISGTQNVEAVTLESSDDHSRSILAVSAVFIAIGSDPDNRLYRDQLPLDDAGYILASEDCLTPISGVYAAGDCRRKPLRQIITAEADGAVAAFQASGYVSLQDIPEPEES